MTYDDLKPNELSYRERDTLLMYIDPLLAYLGAPGDWGYNTVLGQFTQDLRKIQRAVRTSVTKAI